MSANESLSINETLSQHLKPLSEAVGVSGAEGDVRKLILEAIKERVSDVVIDPMGNLTARHRMSHDGAKMRVMISAHMDETGFMVINVGDDGLIRVVDVGHHDQRIIPTQRLLVGNDKIPGVFLWTPIHKSYGKNDLIAPEDMMIDVGADGKDGIKTKPGERVAFAGNYTSISPTIVRGKAFESRAGCAALIELLSDDAYELDLYAAFTAQAAIGGRGGAVAAHRIAPQVAFVLTGITTNDLPQAADSDDHAPLIRLGGGPVISLLDPTLITDRHLVDYVRSVAQAHNIPYQLSALNTERSESGTIGLTRAGVPTLTLAVPIRYMGSPNALLNLDDLQNLIALLRESLKALTPQLVEAKS